MLKQLDGTRGMALMRDMGLSVALAIVLTLGAGCARPGAQPTGRPLAVPGSSEEATAAGTGVQAQNTTADLVAAKRVILVRTPHYTRDFNALHTDAGNHADLDAISWWGTHDAAPFKSVRLWATLRQPNPAAGDATSHVWDLIKATPGSAWVVTLDSNSSE